MPAWLALLVLLAGEYLLVSFRIDAQDILDPARLDGAVAYVGTLAPLAFLALAGVALAGGTSAASALRVLRRPTSAPHQRWIAVALHGVLLWASFYVLQILTEGAPGAGLAAPRVWILAWLVSLAGALVTLVLAFWDPWHFFAAVREARGLFVGGLLVGLLAWGGGLLAQGLLAPLTWLTIELVHGALTVLVQDPVAAPELAEVGTARFFVTIAPECSGLEGVGLMSAFMGAYLYLNRATLRWPHAWVLLPVALLLTWLLNVVRTTTLILIGTFVSPEVALGGFHSKAGWLFFTLVGLCVPWCAARIVVFQPSPPDTPGSVAEELDGNPAAAYLLPLLTILATALVTGLLTSGFDWAYPVRVVVVVLVLVIYRRECRAALLPVGSPGLACSIGLGVAGIWILAFRERDPTATAELARGLGELSPVGAGLWIAARAIGAAIVVPVAEELAFRGYLMRRLVTAEFWTVSYRPVKWVALIGSSLVFGFLHSNWWLGALAGLAYGLVAAVRGRLADAVLAHATTNAAIVMTAFLTSNWALLA